MKQAYIGIGLGVVIIIGGAVWLMLPREPQVPAVTTQTYTEVPIGTVETEDLVSGQGTLSSLLNVGKTLECAFQLDDDTRAREGTGFFHEGKMRIDSFYTASSGEQFTASLITDGIMTYLWSNTEAGESARKLPVLDIAMLSGFPMVTDQLNQDSIVWYTCKAWNVDGSVFVPPANIRFE